LLYVSPRSFTGFSHGGAESAGEESEHRDELGNPESDSDIVVILHVPEKSVAGAGSSDHGLTAEGGVLGEKHSGGDDEDNELEQAGAEVAVNLENSEVCSPGSDEHEESLELDSKDSEGVEQKNDSQLRAFGLAIDVTVVDELDNVLNEVSVDVFSPVDRLC